jgi:hypothetical protein
VTRLCEHSGTDGEDETAKVDKGGASGTGGLSRSAACGRGSLGCGRCESRGELGGDASTSGDGGVNTWDNWGAHSWNGSNGSGHG